MENLKNKYLKEITPKMMKSFEYSSVMQVPKIDKIVLNMGVGDAVFNSKALDDAVEELSVISGQKPQIIKAKKSISNFKLREGMHIGAKVTLRGAKMYYFLEKMISVALPRVRDFRGLSSDSFDGRGSYTLGIKEQIIFPEVNLDKVKKIRGMDVVIVTTAKTDQEGRELLKCFGFPFKRKETYYGKKIKNHEK